MPRIEWHRNRATEALAPTFPDADPVPLGTWGYEWWQSVQADRDYPVDGALVAADGTVVGEVRNVSGRFRVTESTREEYGLTATVADLAVAGISRQIGQDVIMVKAGQVSPGRPLWPAALADIENLRTEVADLTARLEYRIVEAVDQRDALGVTMGQIAEAAGMSGEGVRRMVKRHGGE